MPRFRCGNIRALSFLNHPFWRPMMQDVYIIEAVRSPIGKRGKGLAGLMPADLLGACRWPRSSAPVSTASRSAR